MTKIEYLDAIRSALGHMSDAEVSDILRDFEEHFTIGLSQGKSEHEVSAELGDPVTVARTYSDPEMASIGHTYKENEAEAAKPAMRPATSADDLTGPRVFVVLINLLLTWWVALILLALLAVFWIVGVSMMVGGILAILSAVGAAQIINPGILAGIGLVALSIASLILDFFLTKWSVIGTKAYIAWNKKIYHEGF